MKNKTIVIGVLAILLAISPLTCTVNVHAQNHNVESLSFQSMPISEIFPDENLAKTIALHLNNNDDTNFVVTPEQLNSIDFLIAVGKNIENLKGLEYLKNLNHLDASHNQITDLNPISSLTKLETLNLKDNRISDIQPLQALRQLNNLNLEGNQIDDISTLSNLTAIVTLNLSTNKISDVSPLRSLILVNNLHINNNQIRDVKPLADFNYLLGLELDNNQISDISSLGNVHSNAHMFSVRNQSILLPEVTLGTSTNFTLLNHQGVTPTFNFTVGSGQYDANNGTLHWDTSGENRMVWSGHIFNGVVIQYVAKGINAKTIAEIFPDQNLARSIAMEVNSNDDISAVITPGELAGITDLYIDRKEIKDLTGIEHLINLVFLYLRDNKLEDISPIENLTSLRYLYITNNQIHDLSPLSNISGLRHLDMRSNKISDVTPLAKLNNLQDLQIDNNHISDISSLNNVTLSTLSAMQQAIYLPEAQTSVPFDFILLNQNATNPEVTFINGRGSYNNNQLIWRTAGENQLTWRGPENFTGTVFQNVILGPQYTIAEIFPDENLAKKIAMALHNKEDTSVIVTGEELETIVSLNLHEANIIDLSGLENLINLKYLIAPDNQISDISVLADLDRLEHLYLQDNQIHDLSELSKLINLTYLDFRSNKISDIGVLEGLVNLEHLILDNNQIRDVTALRNLSKINSLYLNSNQISDISSLSNVYNNARNFSAVNQTINLPEGKLGILTEITLLNQHGNVPKTTAVVGNGIYVDSALGVTWITAGENRMDWIGPDNFSGTLIQTVR